MKKLITFITLTAVLAGTGAATMLHSKADIKSEAADFSVSADRSRRPSAYCRKSDGSPVGNENSSSENFCIAASAEGNQNILSADGLPAYCISTHRQKSPTDLTRVTKLTEIPYDSEEYGALFRMASAGASTGTSEYGINDDDLYYVTQCAVRAWIYGINYEELAFFNDDGSLNAEMTNEFRRIAEAAFEEPEISGTEIIIDDSDSFSEKIFTDNSYYYRYGPFQPYSDYTDAETYTVSGTWDSDNVIVTPFEDLISAGSFSEYSFDYPFYVYIKSTYQDEVMLDITADTEITRCEPAVYLSSDESIQNIFQVFVTNSEEKLSGHMSLKNTDTIGDIQLNKKFIADNTEISDEDLISQPRFAVKNEHEKYVSGIQSDGKIVFDHFSDEAVEFALTSESEIYISGLPEGEYTIYEIRGAEGYEAQRSEIAITNTCELNTCIFVNESVTTTITTTVTTEETTTEQTTSVTSSETTATETEVTTTLPEETTATEITEPDVTETITSETTVSETTSESVSSTVNSRRDSSVRISSTPKTGDNRHYAVIVLLMTVSLAAALSFRK